MVSVMRCVRFFLLLDLADKPLVEMYDLFRPDMLILLEVLAPL